MSRISSPPEPVKASEKAPPKEPKGIPIPSTKKDAWVVSHRLSNCVVAVYFRPPSERAFDPRKYSVLKTQMTPKEIAAVHDLRSKGGHPEQGRGMVGI